MKTSLSNITVLTSLITIIIIQSQLLLVYGLQAPPRLTVHLTNQTAVEKRIVILLCESEGDPKPNFIWRKDGKDINKKRLPISKFDKGTFIRIDPLRKNRDEGIYECLVENGVGDPIRSESHIKVLLETEIPPGFPNITSNNPPDETVELNSNVTLPCQASADPPPTYQWLFKSRPIDSYPAFDHKFYINDGNLTIVNITENERGEYECQASNSLGVATSQLTKIKVATELRTPPPDPPSDIKYRLLTPINVMLTWLPPIVADNNPNLKYEISFTKKGTGETFKYDTNQTKHIINHDLSINSEYSVKIRTSHLGVHGLYSKNITIITPKDLPPTPTNVKATAITHNSAMIWWDETSFFSGVVGYKVYYSEMNDPEVEIDFDLWTEKNVSLTNQVVINNLRENVQYVVRVCTLMSTAMTSKLSERVRFFTRPNEVPYDLKFSDLTTHSVAITWKPPYELQVNKYKISYETRKQFYDSQGKLQHFSINKSVIINSSEPRFNTSNLVPYTEYKFNITALVTDQDQFRPPGSIIVKTKVAAPKDMIEPTLMSSFGNTYEIALPTASEEYGQIIYYYVVVLSGNMKKADPDTYLTEDLINLSRNSSSHIYIAAKLNREKMTRRFILGDNKTYDTFLNRPLKRDEQYYVFVRAFVDASMPEVCKSSPLSEAIILSPPRSPDIQPSSAHIGRRLFFTLVIALIVVMFLFAIALLFYRSQKQVQKTNQINETTMKLLPDMAIYGTSPIDPNEQKKMQYMSKNISGMQGPISINDLEDHIEYLKMDNNLKDEYESIEPGQQFTWDNSFMDYNRAKNRYGNVVAYDHSRVVLKTINNILGSDYINASYCDGYRRPNQYIATQGPLKDTVGDFWRMVWEQNSRTIVMMTQLEERGRAKCYQYWPSRGSFTYCGIIITAGDVEELAYYSIRTLTLQYNNEIREIRQFQFTAWPDHGVPDHPTPFLMFLRRIRYSNPADAGPMVVLCSAGVGRTGCFIVIDSMIERIKHESTVDIYGHVTCLRAQRNYIVQTEEQYMFIHDAVHEAVVAVGTEVPVSKLVEYLHRLSQIIPGTRSTGLEIEFKRLRSLKIGNQKFITASLACNKHKNRLMNIMPYENKRVCLEPIVGIEGSDYINASFVDGYRQRNAYIATQGPLPHTVDDFWRMLFEHNSNIIVMLTDLKEIGRDKCTQYWPAERYADYHPYRVELEQEYHDTANLSYILREFKITDTRNPSYCRKIRQFYFIDWSKQIESKQAERHTTKAIDNLINFIAEVHKTKQKFGLEGPITVHCSAGVGRTGVFLALSIVLERLRNESLLDMFETVRTLRTQRPGMVQTEDQYLFCYQTALEYVKNFDRQPTLKHK